MPYSLNFSLKVLFYLDFTNFIRFFVPYFQFYLYFRSVK